MKPLHLVIAILAYLICTTFTTTAWKIIENEESTFTIRTDEYDEVITQMFLSTSFPIFRFSGNAITSRTQCTIGDAYPSQLYYWSLSQHQTQIGHEFTAGTRYIFTEGQYHPEVFNPDNYGGIQVLPIIRPINYPSPDLDIPTASPDIQIKCTNTSSKLFAFDFVAQFWGITKQSLELRPSELLPSCGDHQIYCRKYYDLFPPPLVKMFSAFPVTGGNMYLRTVPTHFHVDSVQLPESSELGHTTTTTTTTTTLSDSTPTSAIRLGSKVNLILQTFDGAQNVAYPEQNDFVSFDLHFYDSFSRRFIASYPAEKTITTMSRPQSSFYLPSTASSELLTYIQEQYPITIVLNYKIKMHGLSDPATMGYYTIFDNVYLFERSPDPLPPLSLSTTLISSSFTGLTVPTSMPFPTYQYVDSDGTNIFSTQLLANNDPATFFTVIYHIDLKVYFEKIYPGMFDDDMVISATLDSVIDEYDTIPFTCEFKHAAQQYQSSFVLLHLLCMPTAGQAPKRSFHALHTFNFRIEYFEEPPTVPERQRIIAEMAIDDLYVSHVSCDDHHNRYYIPYRYIISTVDFSRPLRPQWVCTQCPHSNVDSKDKKICDIDHAQFRVGKDDNMLAPGKTICPELYDIKNPTTITVPTEGDSLDGHPTTLSLATGICLSNYDPRNDPNPCECVHGECMLRKFQNMTEAWRPDEIDVPADVNPYLNTCRCDFGFTGRYCQLREVCLNVPVCATGRDAHENFDAQTASCRRDPSHCDCPKTIHDHGHYDDDDEGIIPEPENNPFLMLSHQYHHSQSPVDARLITSLAGANNHGDDDDDDDEEREDSMHWIEPSADNQSCTCYKQLHGYCHKDNTHEVSYSYQRCPHSNPYSQPHLIRRAEVACNCKFGWAGHDCSRPAIYIQARCDHSSKVIAMASEDPFYLKPSLKHIFILNLIAKLRILMGSDNVMVEIDAYDRATGTIYLVLYTMPQEVLNRDNVQLPYTKALPSFASPEIGPPMTIDEDPTTRADFYEMYQSLILGDRISAGDDSVGIHLTHMFDPHCKRLKDKTRSDDDPTCKMANAPPAYLITFLDDELRQSKAESDQFSAYYNYTAVDKSTTTFFIILAAVLGGMAAFIGIVVLIFYCYKTQTACFYKSQKRVFNNDYEKVMAEAGLYHELSSVAPSHDYASRHRPSITKSIAPNSVAPPKPLPSDDWIYHFDDSTQAYFYINLVTLQSQKHHPDDSLQEELSSFWSSTASYDSSQYDLHQSESTAAPSHAEIDSLSKSSNIRYSTGLVTSQEYANADSLNRSSPNPFNTNPKPSSRFGNKTPKQQTQSLLSQDDEDRTALDDIE